MVDLREIEMPDELYYARVDRTPDMPLGVKVVQFLNLAHSKDGPPMAIYRPLDRTMPVYQAGMRWDYKPLSEFNKLYRPIVDEDEIQRLDDLRCVMYPESAKGPMAG